MSADNRPSMAEMAREAVERSTAAQGLPLRITDPGVLEKVAALVRSDAGGEQRAA